MGRRDIKKQSVVFTLKLNQDQNMDGKFWARILSEELAIVSFLHLFITSSDMKARSSVKFPTFDQNNLRKKRLLAYT